MPLFSHNKTRPNRKGNPVKAMCNPISSPDASESARAAHEALLAQRWPQGARTARGGCYCERVLRGGKGFRWEEQSEAQREIEEQSKAQSKSQMSATGARPRIKYGPT